MGWSIDRALAELDDHINLEAMAPSPDGGRSAPPTLDRMVALCALMADPQHAQPVIHVTGTNGKGSVVRMVSALLAASGLSVGTYTSPDLERVNERLSRNGEPIDDEALAEAIGAVVELEALSGLRPSRFELLTLAAFRWFADSAVDVAVLEVGMGGRWDATNVADGAVAVVTNVSLDHTEYLGPTRHSIALEKAGIVKPGASLVLGETDPSLAAVFEGAGAATTWVRGRELDCTDNVVAVGGRSVSLRTPGATYDDVFLSLHGAHQGDNAALAVAAAEAFFGRPLEDDLVREGMASVEVPGRFEVLGRQPLVVIDGAHNPAGALTASATLDDFSVAGERILVVGMNQGRDPVEMLQALGAASARVVVACAADMPRAMAAEEVASAARSLGVEADVVRSVPDALDRATALATEDDIVLVTGSLYVVGAARAAWRRRTRP
ncbi:MAG TPA: folylpolyglutamate synthase/dihydrofolate synthase family protein [Acidimicrobiales bacterium]|nr:folylpolyglutamate synthase/dihydrofolate synthase family protein [Acidimicrobiales bacterium]